jgi:hypothetical protein
MKTIPGNSIRGQVYKEYNVNKFDKDMRRDFGSMGSGTPLINEVHSGEDEKGNFWYCLIAKPIIQEVVEVFRPAKPKSRSTGRREEEIDTEADISAMPRAGGPDPELFATMRALAASIQTMHVGQQRTDIFLQVVAKNSKTNSS